MEFSVGTGEIPRLQSCRDAFLFENPGDPLRPDLVDGRIANEKIDPCSRSCYSILSLNPLLLDHGRRREPTARQPPNYGFCGTGPSYAYPS